MSYRVCAKCDYVIDNIIHQKYSCPKCNSEEMCCPIEDTRDWDKMYKEQEYMDHMGKLQLGLIND